MYHLLEHPKSRQLPQIKHKAQNALVVNVNPVNRVINQVTSYTFTLTVTQSLSDSCLITVAFPTGSGITFFGTVSCTIGAGFRYTPTCSSPATNTITIQCAQSSTIDSSTYPVYVITVNNIQNPSSAKTLSAITVSTSNGGSTLESGTGTVVYLPVTIPSTRGSLSTANPAVGAYAIFTAQLTITNQVPYDGKIQIIFPKWEGTSAPLPGTMVSKVTTCTAGSDIAGNSPTCTATQNTPTTTQDTVFVSNAFTTFLSAGSLAAGKTFSISISTIRNPPTLQVYSTFEIYTTDSAGNYIEKCSGLALILQSVGALSTDSYVKLSTNTMINQYGTYTIYLKTGDPIPIGGWLRVILPIDLYADTSTLKFTPLAMLTSSATVTVTSNRQIDIKNSITSYVSEGQVFLFTLANIRNPFSTQATSSFQYYTFDSANNGIDQLTTGLTVTATAGALSSVKVYPKDVTSVLQYAKYYQLQFTTANYVDANSQIYIVFPSANFTVTQRTCNISGTPYSGYTCTAVADSNTIKITQFVSSTYAAGTSFSFLIGNLLIRNPSTTKASKTLTVYTAYNGSPIDSDTSATVTATYANITTMTVSASSYITNQDYVTYYFSVVPPGYVITTAIINLTLPSEITINNERSLRQECGKASLSGFVTDGLDCTVIDSKFILIRSGFENGISADPPTLVFSISNLRNPRSVASTGYFHLNIYDASSTYVLYNKTLDVNISMQSASTLKSVSISRGSTINGEITNFTINVQTSSSVVDGDYFLITIPTVNTVKFSESTACIGISVNLYYSLTCTQQSSGTVLKVTMKSRFRNLESEERNLQTYSFSNAQAIFIVTNIRNPQSLRPTDTFKITSYTSSGYLVESTTSGIIIQNTGAQELKFTQLKIQPSSYQVNVNTTYVFTFDPSNYVTGMELYMEIPPEVRVLNTTLTCDPVAGMGVDMNCTYSESTRTLILQNGFPFLDEPRLMKFSISNFTNPPILLQTSTFKIYTYSDGYLLDQKETDLYVNFVCSLPCKTCVQTNNTGCATCYTDGSITGSPFLMNQYCYETCPLSHYVDGQFACQKCYKTACLNCTGPNDGECTVCAEGYSLINGNCVQFANSTYYFPFLILCCIWIVASVLMVINWERQWYITTCIIGVSLFELILMFVEVSAFQYYGFRTNMMITALGGIIVNCLVNIGLMICYLVVFRTNQDVKINLQLDKATHIGILVTSILFTNRFFRLFYSNFANKPSLSLDVMFNDPKSKRTYLIINYLSLLPTLILIANDAFAIYSTNKLNVTFNLYICIERLCISLLVIVLMILEFTVPKRPQFIQNWIFKYNRKGPRTVNEKYNEVASSSFMTMNEMDQSTHSLNTRSNFRNMKVMAIKQLLKNLRHIKPDQLEGRLQDMLDEELAKKGLREDSHGRRASDPAPFSKDNRKSIHYLKSKEDTLKKTLFGNEEEDEDEERKVMTEPLTPRRMNKYREQQMYHDPITFRQDDINMDGLDGNGRYGKSGHATKMDQGIGMSVNTSKDMKGQYLKLQQERERLNLLNEQLKEQRLQLEREKAEIMRMKDEGSKSARGEHLTRAKLEEFNTKGSYTSIGRDRGRSHGRGSLDEVQESQNEDERGKLIRKTLSKDRSQVINSRNQLLHKKGSTHSVKSDFGGLSPNPHRCHGQSHTTLKSIVKLRNKSRTSSVNDGQSLHQSPSRYLGDNGSNFKRNVMNGRSPGQKTYTKKTGTKVYYSDKSESSVEDLMDETPSNYNIPNGRLDGKSTGFRFGQKGQLLDNNSSKRKSNSPAPQVKKKFRQDIGDGDNFERRGSSSLFNIDGNSIPDDNSNFRGNDFNQTNGDLYRAQNNVSNLSMERSHHRQNYASSVMERESRLTQHSKKKQRATGMQFHAPPIPMSGERLKALETAYLTKLVPHKSSTKIAPHLSTMGSAQRVSITQRQGNHTPDITKVMSMLPPQINNFQ